MSDDKDQIVNKIKKAKTDSGELPEMMTIFIKRPELNNLLWNIFKYSRSRFKFNIDEFKGKNFSDFKEKLAEVLVEKICPISKKLINF